MKCRKCLETDHQTDLLIIKKKSAKKGLFIYSAQSCSKVIETNSKNGVVAVATSNVKLFLKTIW